MRYSYVIYKSYWEVFPDKTKIRVKRRVSVYYYSLAEVKEATIQLRNKYRNTSLYNYKFGDRIYFRRNDIF